MAMVPVESIAGRRPRRGSRRLPWTLVAGIVLLVPFLVMALVPGLIAPSSPTQLVAAPLLPPSGAHLLGTDEVGRDILSRVIWAARNDVVISLSSTLVAFILGTSLGLLVGYLGGWLDATVMRLVDVMLSFPTIVLALFLIAVLGQGLLVQILAIALVMAPSMARLSRGTGLVLRGRGYVEASKVAHGSTGHILRWHLLPNAFSTLSVAASVLAASAVLVSAALSYLGLGTRPPTPSWGNLLRAAYDLIYNSPWYAVAPGACITVLAGAYMLLGAGLRQLQAEGAPLARGAGAGPLPTTEGSTP